MVSAMPREGAGGPSPAASSSPFLLLLLLLLLSTVSIATLSYLELPMSYRPSPSLTSPPAKPSSSSGPPNVKTLRQRRPPLPPPPNSRDGAQDPLPIHVGAAVICGTAMGFHPMFLHNVGDTTRMSDTTMGILLHRSNNHHADAITHVLHSHQFHPQLWQTTDQWHLTNSNEHPTIPTSSVHQDTPTIMRAALRLWFPRIRSTYKVVLDGGPIWNARDLLLNKYEMERVVYNCVKNDTTDGGWHGVAGSIRIDKKPSKVVVCVSGPLPGVDLKVAGLHILTIDRKAQFKQLKEKTDKKHAAAGATIVSQKSTKIEPVGRRTRSLSGIEDLFTGSSSMARSFEKITVTKEGSKATRV